MSDDVTRERYLSQGRQLVPVDDMVIVAGPQWEFSDGLIYEEVDSSTTTVQAVALVTEEDIIETLAAVHYCDILSPYRALEWIYDKAVVHG